MFLEFFIVADGVLFERIFSVISNLSTKGVDIRIIYDDMGSHKVLSRKTKRILLPDLASSLDQVNTGNK